MACGPSVWAGPDLGLIFGLHHDMNDIIVKSN